MDAHVVSRDDLEHITTVEVDGIDHELGIVKDFHRNDLLAKFVPDLARLSLSWVYLAPGQELAVHAHPTKSMIIVTHGAGRVLGDVTGPIRDGDVVIVPEQARHGFVADTPDGFWALSAQFEGAGLYEHPEQPRVAFASDIPTATRPEVAAVIAVNERHMAEFGRNSIAPLMRSCAADDENPRTPLLDVLQPWSDEFQRVIAARVAAEHDPSANQLALDHLVEEAGHNNSLRGTQDGTHAEWDPVVAAVASWFIDQMTGASTVARIVLAHLVLEGGSLVFHSAANDMFPGNKYFALHDSADFEHLQMGYRALEERQDWTGDQVFGILRQGWQMVALLVDRFAELVRGGGREL